MLGEERKTETGSGGSGLRSGGCGCGQAVVEGGISLDLPGGSFLRCPAIISAQGSLSWLGKGGGKWAARDWPVETLPQARTRSG